MKQILTSLLMLAAACSAALAGDVSPAVAEMVARQYLKASLGCAVSVTPVDGVGCPTKGPSGTPDYYVFDAERGGFVIIAGDDRLSPVIGWSPEGEFSLEGMPDNMASWMGMWSDIVGDVRAGRLAPQPGAAREWDDVSSGRTQFYASASRQLTTATWDQEYPYNLFCPDGSMAGCVAVATAIIMHYYKWPAAGQGTIPGYNYVDDSGVRRTIEPISLGHEYKWDIMPLKVDGSAGTEALEEVARLIYEAGVMVRASFNRSGTGASSSNVEPGLATHFGYDASSCRHYAYYFTADEWQQVLCRHIDEVGPVYYTASSNKGNGSHAMVIDGYSEGRFHINWGWGGRGNGFFTMPNFAVYTEGHSAILNIKPDAGGVIPDNVVIDSSDGNGGLTSATTDFKRGEPFNVECYYIVNRSYYPFDGEVALAVKHRDGSMGQMLTRDPLSIEPWRGLSYYFTNCIITEDILVGDGICVWYRSAATPQWTQARANLRIGDVGEIPIADAQGIAEVSSFDFSAETGLLVVSTKPDAQWTLADASGASLTAGVTFAEGRLTIDTRQYASGSYFLTLSKGSDSKTVEFVFGLKK